MARPHEPMQANKALWDEWTTINMGSEFYRLDQFKDPKDNRLRDYEIEHVGDVAGKDLLHLQCHFGLDTLSWARLGANATGVDFSSEGIAQARRIASELGIEARFVESNVYDLTDNLSGSFDVVYTSRGVLGWLPELEGWALVISHFLKPGGFFYITEMHPSAWVLDEAEELRIRYPYFARSEPVAWATRGSYADTSAEVEQPFEYCWPHPMSEIINSLIRHGLRIDFLEEYPFLEWPAPFLVEEGNGRYVLPPEQQGEIPLFFALKATKE
ncbi:MAG: class I SAM-dependent methyltransferase [Actinomycetota bacterium]|nr:class I SAM-dependent methyltransferase [Actinomycetota bacterium]